MIVVRGTHRFTCSSGMPRYRAVSETVSPRVRHWEAAFLVADVTLPDETSELPAPRGIAIAFAVRVKADSALGDLPATMAEID